MQILNIYDRGTEEIIGAVTAIGVVDFNKFEDEVTRTYKQFCKDGLDEDFSIIDFVDYHNENSEMQIDWVVIGYIQI